MVRGRGDSRAKFLEAALTVIRSKGYEATTVDDLCAAAGLTKGSFFHHFDSKEELAIEAANHFANMAAELFENAPFRAAGDPLDRVLGYVDLRIALMRGELYEYTCLLGTIVQECYATHPALRTACDRHLRSHADELARDLALAKAQYAPSAPWTVESLASHMQAVVQGAFVLAKAQQSSQVAVDCLQHLRRYLELQFGRNRSLEA